MDAIAAVVLQRRAQVETRSAVGSPGGTDSRLVMDNDFSAGGGDRMGSEVKGTSVESSIGGDERVGGIRKKMVEAYFCLGKKFVPQLERKVCGGGAESRDKMVFKGSYGSFSFQGPMLMRRAELD